MNRLFVANKPINISSNAFLTKLKKKYGVKKAGFSGTLDPFACGALLIAFGGFTRLFKYLDTDIKSYEAVLWLGANSPSFDTQNIKVQKIKPFKIELLKQIQEELVGELSYSPPIYSAKKIAGKRAYELARAGFKFELLKSSMFVYESKLLSYNHPFLRLKLAVSKGAYIRSYSQLFAEKLKACIALSHLKRLKEGAFFYENEKALNPLNFLKLPKNYINCDKILEYGRKIALSSLKIQADGDYYIETKDYFSIINIKQGIISYHLNKVKKC